MLRPGDEPQPCDAVCASQAAEAADEVEEDADGGESALPQCSICLGAMVGPASEHRALPCKHAFHTECIDAWLVFKERACCPLCRVSAVFGIGAGGSAVACSVPTASTAVAWGWDMPQEAEPALVARLRRLAVCEDCGALREVAQLSDIESVISLGVELGAMLRHRLPYVALLSAQALLLVLQGDDPRPAASLTRDGSCSIVDALLDALRGVPYLSARLYAVRVVSALLGLGERGPSFAYSLPVHSFHMRRDRVASLTTCR